MGLARMGAAIVLVLSLTSAARAADLYSTSFEFAQGFTTGLLLDDGFRTTANPGQGGWYGEDYNTEQIATFTGEISTEQAHTGTQSLRIGAELPDTTPTTFNTYKLYSHDFTKHTSGVVTAEWWYYLESLVTGVGGGADTNNVWFILGDRDNGVVLNGVQTNFGGSILSPNALVVSTGEEPKKKISHTNIAAAGVWRGLKMETNIDTRRFDLYAKDDSETEWTKSAENFNWWKQHAGPPNSLGTVSIYQISPGSSTGSFSNPEFGAYVDDISITVALGGDYDGDGDADADDIDLMLANLTGSDVFNEDYDLDGDFDADQADLIKYIRDIIHTEFGDWNLDGSVDLADFNLWLNSDGTGGWTEGDGNGDGSNDLADFNMWLGESPPPTAPQAVLTPEPASLALLGLGGLALLGRRRVRQRPRR